jgi:hypothetical protein
VGELSVHGLKWWLAKKNNWRRSPLLLGNFADFAVVMI